MVYPLVQKPAKRAISKALQFDVPDVSMRGRHDVFRRYPGGKLDIDYAAFKVIEVLNSLREMGQGGYVNPALTEADKALLTVIAPNLPTGMPIGIARTVFKISEHELELIRSRVMSFLAEAENWNAGQGGGSVPGRHITMV